MPEYVQFWIVLITVPNLIVIGLMILVFALALVVPLPRHLESEAGLEPEARSEEGGAS